MGILFDRDAKGFYISAHGCSQGEAGRGHASPESGEKNVSHDGAKAIEVCVYISVFIDPSLRDGQFYVQRKRDNFPRPAVFIRIRYDVYTGSS